MKSKKYELASKEKSSVAKIKKTTTKLKSNAVELKSLKKKSKTTVDEKQKGDLIDGKLKKKVKAKKVKIVVPSEEGPKEKQKAKKTGTKRKLENGDDEKTKKLKLINMSKKDRKETRKKNSKTNYEVIQRAKEIWENLRRHDCAKEKREKLLNELCELIKGKAPELVYSHDAVRVIQCCLQYGSQEQRDMIFLELKERVAEIACSKYGKFSLVKILRYGSKQQRDYIIKCFYGNVRRLVRHKEASEVLEYAYNNHANAAQRASLMEEFYGAHYAIFKTPGQGNKLAELIENHPEKKKNILESLRDTLQPLLEKSVVKHTIVHRALMDFFTYADLKMKADMIEALREAVVEILHTRDGTHVAMECVWHGTAKDRKVIIKSFKSYVEKICKEEYGHLVLLAIFDVVDDTKIVHKALFPEILRSLMELVTDQYGRKLVLYLLSPRNPSHFHPQVIKTLQKGDDNATSKKDKEVRRKELLEIVADPLMQFVAAETEKLIRDKSLSQLTLTIFEATMTTAKPEEVRRAMESVADLADEELVPCLLDSEENLDEMHIAEHPAGHFFFKKLIKQDKERIGNDQTVLFSEILLESVSEDNLKSWVSINRGAFILASLLECGVESVEEKTRNILKPVMASLKSYKHQGADLIRKKLSEK